MHIWGGLTPPWPPPPHFDHCLFAKWRPRVNEFWCHTSPEIPSWCLIPKTTKWYQASLSKRIPLIPYRNPKGNSPVSVFAWLLFSGLRALSVCSVWRPAHYQRVPYLQTVASWTRTPYSPRTRTHSRLTASYLPNSPAPSRGNMAKYGILRRHTLNGPGSRTSWRRKPSLYSVALTSTSSQRPR